MMDIDQGNKEIPKQVHLPFVEKYRPDDLNEIISHQEIIGTIRRFIDGKKLPHLLFHGPPGTGKTSCIIAIAKKLYGQQYKNMTLELNASDERGIDVVREKVKSFCSTQQLMSKGIGIKLVILDECDSMTNAAQFALRRIVEKYTKTTRFCLICNYVSKIIPALQSRCTRFRFGPLDDNSVLNKLNEVAKAEELVLEKGADQAIVSLSGGDMRKVLNILESCSLAYKTIPVDKIFEVTGRPSPVDVKIIFDAVSNKSFNEANDIVLKLKLDKSLSVDDIVREVHTQVMATNMTDEMKMFLVNRLSEIEYRLAQGSNEKVQIASVIGSFMEVRTIRA